MELILFLLHPQTSVSLQEVGEGGVLTGLMVYFYQNGISGV